MNPQYEFLIKPLVGVLLTIGLYSVLYRENKFYRFVEHIFLGLSSGWMLVAIWTDILKENWWDKMTGIPADPATGATEQLGYWAWVMLIPLGLLAYLVFNKKNNWASRIPIGIILGLWAGQQFSAWSNRYLPQIENSLKPLWPTDTASFFQPGTAGVSPEELARINSNVYASQAISNLVFTITLLSVLSYFLFSFEIKNKAVRNFATMGRWLLMVGFGAIFGTTVMMRFTLLIDRMNFIWIESIQDRIIPFLQGRL